MKQKRHSVDQIISKLRQADVALGKGQKAPSVELLYGPPRGHVARRGACPDFRAFHELESDVCGAARRREQRVYIHP